MRMMFGSAPVGMPSGEGYGSPLLGARPRGMHPLVAALLDQQVPMGGGGGGVAINPALLGQLLGRGDTTGGYTPGGGLGTGDTGNGLPFMYGSR